MKKNNRTIRRIILFVILVCIGQIAYGVSTKVTIGNFQYELDMSTNNATVKGLASNVKSLSNVKVPDSVTHNGNNYIVNEIGALAFSGNTKITGTLQLPSGLTKIGDSAFRNCTNLSGNLILPKDLASIGTFAFESCVNFVGTLELPSSIEYIGDAAFRYCSGFIGTLYIPEGVSIGSAAFESCIGFTGLILPDSAIISGIAFRNCKNMGGTLVINGEILGNVPGNIISNTSYFEGCGFSKVILNMSHIPSETFRDCKNIETVILQSTKSLSSYSFAGCDNLKNVICTSETPPTHSKGKFLMPDSKWSWLPYCAFSSVYPRENPSSSKFPYNSVNVYVPESSITKYKKEFEWKTFKNIRALVSMPEQVTLSNEQSLLRQGETLFLKTHIIPDEANKSLIWSSSNESVASVTLGVVKANGWGTATITATTVNGLTASCEVTVWMIGDVNNDGAINIADVTLTTSYIAGLEPDDCAIQAADINEDGEITISDAVMIAQMVLSAETITAKSSSHLKARSMDGTAILDATFNGNQIGLSTLEDNITALQADIILPQGVTASDIHMAERYMNSHLLMTAQRGENVVRLVVFALDNSLLVPGDDIILIDTKDGTNICADNILVSDEQGRTKALSLQRNNLTTAIDEISPENFVRINIVEGGIIVDGAIGCEIICYDIYGRISAHICKSIQSEAIQLPEGLNIVKVNNLIKSVYIK